MAAADHRQGGRSRKLEKAGKGDRQGEGRPHLHSLAAGTLTVVRWRLGPIECVTPLLPSETPTPRLDRFDHRPGTMWIEFRKLINWAAGSTRLERSGAVPTGRR